MSAIDVHNIAEFEKKIHGIPYKDEDFEVEGIHIPSYAMSAEQLQTILDSWKETSDKGRERLNVVCQGAQPLGAFHYTFTRNPVSSAPELVLHWLQVQPKAPTTVFTKVFDWLVEVAKQSVEDVEIFYVIPDVRSYNRTLEFLVGQENWKRELVPDFFVNDMGRDAPAIDGWHFTLNVKGTPKTKSNKK